MPVSSPPGIPGQPFSPMSMVKAKLANLLWRARLRGRDLQPLAAANLHALDHLDPAAPALSYGYVVLDLETTGLDSRRDRVVSAGAVRVVQGRVRLGDRFHELIDPGREVPAASIKVHGLTPGMLSGARRALEAFDDFLAWLGHDILVAHNAGFDLQFIHRTMRRAYGFPLQNLVLDTVRLCQAVWLPSDPYGVDSLRKVCSLDALCRRFSLPLPERHTALGDALATAMIFQRLLVDMDQAGQGTLRDLVRAGQVHTV